MAIRPGSEAVHLSHCFQRGDGYDDSCKYGDDEHCPARPLRESEQLQNAMLAADALQGSDTTHPLRAYVSRTHHLAMLMKVRHRGATHASVVEYEVHKDGALIDFSGALCEMVSRFNQELVKIKLG